MFAHSNAASHIGKGSPYLHLFQSKVLGQNQEADRFLRVFRMWVLNLHDLKIRQAIALKGVSPEGIYE